MNILFLSYWGINDPLTQSTVLPHVRILKELEVFDRIILCTIERDEVLEQSSAVDLEDILFQPLHSKSSWHPYLTKIKDIANFRDQVIQKINDHKIDALICRSSLAGSIGYEVYRKTNVPFYVESFEPHADYMVENGEWSKWGLKYRWLKNIERKQMECAKGLLPVSFHYEQLLGKNVPSKRLQVVPCCIDLELFKYSEIERQEKRTSLGLNSETVGIYVGKFGGLYYDKEAYKVFASALNYFQDFKLILLSPSPSNTIERQLATAGFRPSQFHIATVERDKVASYLSAADFAFSMVRPRPSSKYCSPIKNGEYWASGLPFILPAGVNDDEILTNTESGAVLHDLDQKSIDESLDRISEILAKPHHRTDIAKIAGQYRSFDICRKAYQYYFTRI